jgi:hypothetical protein
VDVVDAAADGILLDDSHAHDGCLPGEEEADVSDESKVWSRQQRLIRSEDEASIVVVNKIFKAV